MKKIIFVMLLAAGFAGTAMAAQQNCASGQRWDSATSRCISSGSTTGTGTSGALHATGSSSGTAGTASTTGSSNY